MQITEGAQSAEAVAFNLAVEIRSHERSRDEEFKNDPRKYILDLYAQCLDAVQGRHGGRGPKAYVV